MTYFYIERPTRKDAIRDLCKELHSNYIVTIIGDGSDIKKITLEPLEVLKFSSSDIDARLIELQAAYDAQAYARSRQAEYPTIQELVVALYDTNDRAAVDAKRAAVKAKFPKP